jgi:hypothetical protein
MNTFLNWTAFIGLAWCVTAGCGWWPGPIAVMTDAVSRHRNRTSDDEDIDDEDIDDDVMTPEPQEELPRRVVMLQRPLTGPRPLEELLGDPDDDEDLDTDENLDEVDDGDDYELPRREWVRRQIRAGKRAGWIDAEGARIYRCHQRTIARERDAVTKGNRGRTMGGGR